MLYVFILNGYSQIGTVGCPDKKIRCTATIAKNMQDKIGVSSYVLNEGSS